MEILEGVKPGDKLFVTFGHIGKGHIVSVDRVTPSGRVITRIGDFNPNGLKRGDGGWARGRARLATPNDIKRALQDAIISRLSSFQSWENLSACELNTVAGIINKYL